MKPRKFERTLSLNKKTIAHLSSSGMGRVYGGQTVEIDCTTGDAMSDCCPHTNLPVSCYPNTVCMCV